MSTIASQITSLTIVYSTFYSGADQSKHQSSASLAFVWAIHRGPVNSPHKWPVTRKMFPFDDVIMKFNKFNSRKCIDSVFWRMEAILFVFFLLYQCSIVIHFILCFCCCQKYVDSFSLTQKLRFVSILIAIHHKNKHKTGTSIIGVLCFRHCCSRKYTP